ncbi:MAG: sugar ABC transporter permease [Treponema sp.]|nr:sugar ABC transporter permease [Treponema sp.]
MRTYYSGKRQLKEDAAGFLFISPWLIGFLAFAIIPMGMSFYFSFTRYNLFTPPVFDGLENFKRMITDPLFWKTLQVTFVYAFFSVSLRLIFAFFLASLFKRASWMTKVYTTAYYIPSLVGASVAIAVLWRRIFMSDGLINIVLQAVGINSTISWIGNPETALGVIVVLAIWQFGSSMLIFLAGLRQIPKTYYEAASIDGAGWLNQFFRITLPQMTPIIFFNLIMQLINGFTAFSQAFIISGGTGDPQYNTLFYALYVYMRAFRGTPDMGYASALAWVLVLIIAVFTIIIFKTQDRWVHYES